MTVTFPLLLNNKAGNDVIPNCSALLNSLIAAFLYFIVYFLFELFKFLSIMFLMSKK